MQPISDQFDPEAMAVNGLDRDRLAREAATPGEAMTAAAAWVDCLRPLGRPVFLAAPAVWDGMFVHCYFVRFAGPGGMFGARRGGSSLTGRRWGSGRDGATSSPVPIRVMPQLMTRLERLGCPKRIVSLVAPAGYVFNGDGACLYLGFATRRAV
jgi:hypothetical protein